MADDLDDLLEEFLQREYDEAPVTASALGLEGYDDELGDYSAEGWERKAAGDADLLARFEAIPEDGRSVDERIDRELVISVLRGRRTLSDWQVWRRNPDVYLSPGLQGVFTLFLHRLRPEPELAASAAARLDKVPQVLAEAQANLDPALASPVLARRALGQCRAAVRYARELVPAEVSSSDDRQRVAEAGERAAAAYEEFATFLERLEAQATGEYAIGEERYTGLLREKEMLGFDTAELHERGRQQHALLSADIARRARDVAGTDDWRAVLADLHADHAGSPEEMRAEYEDWTDRARQFLKDRSLVSFPPGEQCQVEPSPPFQRPVLAVASYQRPPAFRDSRRGHFFVPFPPDGTGPAEVQKRLESNSRHAVPSISVHEAYPGHHWHLVTAMANPRPVRRVLGTPYFNEGWALYAEIMMKEQGFFTDPRDEMCQVEARLFRAARIVVDTSLHTGTMSFEEAVTFMVDNAALPEPTARAEVARYCNWPTQAAAYLTGSLEIERVRADYLSRGRGDLRTFHDTIAAAGMLPVALAERAVLAAPA